MTGESERLAVACWAPPVPRAGGALLCSLVSASGGCLPVPLGWLGSADVRGGCGQMGRWGSALPSRTAILVEDVRIPQMTGIPPQWSGGEVSPRRERTSPIR